MGYYHKETEPKGVKSSDMTGQKRVGASKVDKEYGGEPSTTGAKPPKGATASDISGERKAPVAGGVGMGKADGLGLRDESHMGHHDGRLGEMNGHMGEKTVYEHERYPHDQDGM